MVVLMLADAQARLANMLALGLKCRMELDIAMGGRSAKEQREHVLLGDTLKDERRIAGKSETGAERRITDQNAPVRANLAKFGKPASIRARPMPRPCHSGTTEIGPRPYQPMAPSLMEIGENAICPTM